MCVCVCVCILASSSFCSMTRNWYTLNTIIFDHDRHRSAKRFEKPHLQ